MDPDRWRRIEDIFQAVLDCDPGRRAAFLDDACAGDAELRAEVDSLLAAHHDTGFKTSVAMEEALGALEFRSDELGAGRRIGPYKVVRMIGRGGMGSVYAAARDDDAFQKVVAIKVIRRGLDTDDIIRRFRAERQILATLDHPNITRLLDGGTTDDGLPYFVMELIEGEPIDRYCDGHKLAITERLKLFQSVCEAVRYAHQNLVVHRDIKPGNVLVTREGVPRLLDFGIAKLLAADPEASHTRTNASALTPEFASPEQLRGDPVTTATDVYSLGVLLHVLLTGSRPDRESGPGSAPPAKPSSRAPETSRRRIAGDLDNIVLMALHDDPKRRYASAEQLSDDIRRHLTKVPVIARPDTRGYRTARFIQRNKGLVAAAVAVLLTLTAGVAATLWQARVARRERDAARLEQAKAARINAFLQDMIGYSGQTTTASPKRAKGKDATVIDMLDDAARRVETELEDQPAVKAEMLGTIGGTYSVLANYDAARRYLQEAYELDLKLYGPDGMQTGMVMNVLADVSYLTGDTAKAETWIRKALPILRAHKDDPGFQFWLLPAALSDAGFIMRARGKLDEAEALWFETLSHGPRADARHRTQAIMPKSFLAQLYMDRGDVAKAEPLAAEAAAELRAIDNRFALAQSLIDLGNIRRSQRRFAEAEPLIEEGTKFFADAQGSDHPNVAYGLTSLALTYYYEGRYDMAEQNARKALQIVTPRFKDSNYDAAVSTMLGRLLCRTGRFAEGDSLMRHGLAIVDARAPKQSNVRGVTLGSLGECLSTRKQYSEAEPLLKESYEILKAIHVPQSPVLEEARQRLVSLYDAWGKPQEAAHYRSGG